MRGQMGRHGANRVATMTINFIQSEVWPNRKGERDRNGDKCSLAEERKLHISEREGKRTPTYTILNNNSLPSTKIRFYKAFKTSHMWNTGNCQRGMPERSVARKCV